MDMPGIPVLRGLPTIAQPTAGIKPAMAEISIAPPRPEDYPDWRRLYDGYAAFYKMPMDDAIAGRVWQWLLDPQHALDALLARDHGGKVVGLAHFRAIPRTRRLRPRGQAHDVDHLPNGFAGAVNLCR